MVFLTVHGVGSSFNTWVEFSGDESMEDIRKRAMFLHVSLPGQHPGAEDLHSDYVFPGMEVFWTAGGGPGGWSRGKYYPTVCHEPSGQGNGGAGHQHGGSGHRRV